MKKSVVFLSILFAIFFSNHGFAQETEEENKKEEQNRTVDLSAGIGADNSCSPLAGINIHVKKYRGPAPFCTIADVNADVNKGLNKNADSRYTAKIQFGGAANITSLVDKKEPHKFNLHTGLKAGLDIALFKKIALLSLNIPKICVQATVDTKTQRSVYSVEAGFISINQVQISEDWFNDPNTKVFCPLLNEYSSDYVAFIMSNSNELQEIDFRADLNLKATADYNLKVGKHDELGVNASVMYYEAGKNLDKTQNYCLKYVDADVSIEYLFSDKIGPFISAGIARFYYASTVENIMDCGNTQEYPLSVKQNAFEVETGVRVKIK